MATLRKARAQLSLWAARLDTWIRLRSPRLRALLPHWVLLTCGLFALACGCVGLLTPLYATGHASGGRVLIIELLASVLASSWVVMQWRTRAFLPRHHPLGMMWSPLGSLLLLSLVVIPPLAYEAGAWGATPQLRGGYRSQAYKDYQDLERTISVLEDNHRKIEDDEMLLRTLRYKCDSDHVYAAIGEESRDSDEAAPDREKSPSRPSEQEVRRRFCAAPEPKRPSPFCHQLRQVLCHSEAAQEPNDPQAMTLLHVAVAESAIAERAESPSTSGSGGFWSWAVKPMRYFDGGQASSPGTSSAITSRRVRHYLICQNDVLPTARDVASYRRRIDSGAGPDVSQERLAAIMSRHLPAAELSAWRRSCPGDSSLKEQDESILRMRREVRAAADYAISGSYVLRPKLLLVHLWLLLLGASIVACAGTLQLASLLKAAAIHVVIIVLGGPFEDAMAPSAEGTANMVNYLTYVVAPRAVVAVGLLLWLWRNRARSASTDVAMAWLVLLAVAFNANSLLENVAQYGAAGLLLEHMYDGWKSVFLVCIAAGVGWLLIMHAFLSRYRRRPLSQ